MPRPRSAGAGRFRLRAKRVFLTYPQWSDGREPVELETIKGALLALGGSNGIPAQCKGGVLARELHADGHVHLHAVLEYDQPTELKTDKAYDIDGKHPHIEAVAHLKQCLTYCKKDNTYIEWGSCVLPPTRQELLDKVASGQLQLHEAAEQLGNRWVGFDRLQRDLLAYKQSKRQRGQWRNLEVWWLYGPSGIGKSRWANAKFPNAYRFPRTGKFFERYCGETELIFDDYRADLFKYHELLSILDGYDLIVEIKGTSAYAEWTKVIITSDKHPEEIYRNNWDQQLRRRINHLCDFGNPMQRWLLDNQPEEEDLADAPDVGLLAEAPSSPIGDHWI